MSLAPNALLPCPSESHRRTALAHGRICPTCEPDVEWMARCPSCYRPVTAVGLTVQRHAVGGRGRSYTCPGSGMAVESPAWANGPIRGAA